MIESRTMPIILASLHFTAVQRIKIETKFHGSNHNRIAGLQDCLVIMQLVVLV